VGGKRAVELDGRAQIVAEPLDRAMHRREVDLAHVGELTAELVDAAGQALDRVAQRGDLL
jgi:hypothetical protein